MNKRALVYVRCSTTQHDKKPEVQLEELRRYFLPSPLLQAFFGLLRASRSKFGGDAVLRHSSSSPANSATNYYGSDYLEAVKMSLPIYSNFAIFYLCRCSFIKQRVAVLRLPRSWMICQLGRLPMLMNYSTALSSMA